MFGVANMQNVSAVITYDSCCGCGICSGICPVTALSMNISADGFYRPIVDDKTCVNCGLCYKCCPMTNENINKNRSNEVFGSVINTYSGWAKDKNVRYQGASGGIATALSLEYLGKEHVIGATKYDETNPLRTKSVICSDEEGLLSFKSSKYMPSEYSNIVRFVIGNKNKKIVIVGLPCQVAGIRNVINQGKIKNRIILIDILCGKVVSYHLIEKYVNEKFNSNLKGIEFRDKISSWYNFSLTLNFDGIKRSEDFRSSQFGQFWIDNRLSQKACYECAYRSAGSSDLTLGDFWDWDKFGNEIEGVSLIVTRTELGEKIIRESNSILVQNQPRDCLPKTQPHFTVRNSPEKVNELLKRNKQLYKDLHRFTLLELDKKYNKKPFVTRLKQRLKSIFIS